MGSLGEGMAQEAYNITLEKTGTRGHDALDEKGRRIQIRINSGSSTPLKFTLPENLLALKFTASGTFEEIYNGPSRNLKTLFKARKSDSSGFIAITHNNLRALMASVSAHERV